MKLLRKCRFCGGRGWYTTGHMWRDAYGPDDNITEHDCEDCHGCGRRGPLWPLAWTWRRFRTGWRWLRRSLQPPACLWKRIPIGRRWLRRWLQPAEPIPF